MKKQKTLFLLALAIGYLSGSLIMPARAVQIETDEAQRREAMPDISGLAWIEQDSFIAIHDAKNPEENSRPRVSLLRLPQSPEGVRWRPLNVSWPAPLLESSDLESIARIPSTSLFLLVESGESIYNERRFSRVFLVELKNERLEIRSLLQLPATIVNIEGSAVAKFGERLIFIWAERGDGQPRTKLFWADLELEPFKLGKAQQVYFKPGRFSGKNWRPVSAIEIDGRGRVYIASAYDPNDDNGPFTSIIWRAGRVRINRTGRVSVNLFNVPRQIARLDGLKVESIAVRERPQALYELFIGVDDENFGGAIRRIANKL